MIPLPTDMILASVIFATIYGMLCGIAYSLIRHLFFVAVRLMLKVTRKEKCSKSHHTLSLNILDAVFVFTVGLLYMVAAYVLVDGVLEIYSSVMLLVGIFVGKRFFDRIFHKLMKNDLKIALKSR